MIRCMALVFSGVTSAAVPDATHATMKFGLLPLLGLFLPLAVDFFYKPPFYFSCRRASITGLSISLILSFSFLVDTQNYENGVYDGTNYDYSRQWIERSNKNLINFFLVGSFSGFIFLSALLGFLFINLSLKIPSLKYYITIPAAIVLILSTPSISWTPTYLFKQIRPLQTVISTALLSLFFTLADTKCQWNTRVLLVIYPPQCALTLWTAAQIHHRYSIILGLAGCAGYMTAIATTISAHIS